MSVYCAMAECEQSVRREELTRPRAERRSDGCSKFGPLALSRPSCRSGIFHDTPSMRYLALFTLCCALLAALAFAEPAPRAPPLQQRRVVPFGSEANLQRDRAAPAPPAQAKHTDEASNNYVRPLPIPLDAPSLGRVSASHDAMRPEEGPPPGSEGCQARAEALDGHAGRAGAALCMRPSLRPHPCRALVRQPAPALGFAQTRSHRTLRYPVERRTAS